MNVAKVRTKRITKEERKEEENKEEGWNGKMKKACDDITLILRERYLNFF